MLNRSDNAVMAKVRALYGRRLTEADYDRLVAQKSVGDLVTCLRSTRYAEVLGEVKEELVHRGQLENLLRRVPLDIYTRLLKYAGGEPLFLRLYIMRSEIEQLLMAIRLLNSGGIDRYIIALPVHLAKHMSFDLFAIAGIKTFDDLLGILEHSGYYGIVGRYRPSGSHGIIDITACEADLLSWYYSSALDMVERGYGGEARESLKHLLYRQITLYNLSLVFRMRYFLKAGRDVIGQRLVRTGGLNMKPFDMLLAADGVREMNELVSKLPAFRRIGFEWSGDGRVMARHTAELRERYNRKVFRFSTHPAVVVITYTTLLENELNNLVTIIEGIRYGTPSSELKGLLCL